MLVGRVAGSRPCCCLLHDYTRAHSGRRQGASRSARTASRTAWRPSAAAACSSGRWSCSRRSASRRSASPSAIAAPPSGGTSPRRRAVGGGAQAAHHVLRERRVGRAQRAVGAGGARVRHRADAAGDGRSDRGARRWCARCARCRRPPATAPCWRSIAICRACSTSTTRPR